MGKMPDGKVMYTLDGRPVTEEPEGSPEEKHYKRIINQVGGRGTRRGPKRCRGCRAVCAPPAAARHVAPSLFDAALS